jgi:RimJ/RimL family protein N-acetyltransferase
VSELTYRRANLSDSRDLFEWRNDLATRKASMRTNEVTWDEHTVWFEKVIASDESNLLIFHDVNVISQKIGMTRIDTDKAGTEAEISINVNPALRGRGFSVEMVSSTVSNAFKEFEHVNVIHAVVREDNLASLRVFEKAGFSLDSRGSGVAHFSVHRPI